MLLDATDTRLEALLEAAPAANQPSFVVDWVEVTATAIAPAGTDGLLSGTSAVDMVEPPASGAQRRIASLRIHNRDTAQVAVRVRFRRAGASRVLIRALLPAGAFLHWDRKRGWQVIDDGRSIRSVKGRVVRDLTTYQHVDNQASIRADYVSGQVASSALTTQATTAANLYARPFVAPLRRSPTIDRIGIYVTTGLAASTFRLGIYGSRATASRNGKRCVDAYPGSLLYDSGDLATTVNGQAVTAAPSLVLEPGRLYWAVGFSSGIITVRALALTGCASAFGYVEAINGTGAQNGFYGPATGGDPSVAYGALPSIFPAVALSVATSPLYFIRYSS